MKIIIRHKLFLSDEKSTISVTRFISAAVACLFFLTLSSFVSPLETEFSSMENIKKVLDGSVYSVPGYGEMKFSFNRKDFKAKNETGLISSSSCSADPIKYATFDVKVKKQGKKKYDRITYKLEIEYPELGEYRFKDPNLVYYSGFQFIEISEFPCTFLVLANGQLFFEKTSYEKFGFEDVKNRLIGDGESNSKFTYGGYSLYNYKKDWVECPILD